MRLNQAGSDKWNRLLTGYALPEKEIWATLRTLFEPDSFRAALLVLRREWRSVLRDPCSRTNSVLVRPDWLTPRKPAAAMNHLLDSPPFAPRDDAAFLAGMNEICAWHLTGCPEYRRVWPEWSEARRLEDLAFLHVGVFKRQLWKTAVPGIVHQRTLRSSSTTQATASMIALDERSSALQAQSSGEILKELVGESLRPLAILDHSHALRQRGEASARIVAAMSLRPLASEIHFLLDDEAMNWYCLGPILAQHRQLPVYGFTWMLWQGWATATIPEPIRQSLAGTEVHLSTAAGGRNWKPPVWIGSDRRRSPRHRRSGIEGH